MKTSSWIFAGLLGLTGVIGGCAKDRTIDDYRRDRVSQELQRFQAIAGVYRGSMASVSTGEWIGNVALELKAETAIGESSDKLTQEPKAVLRAKASIQNSGAATAVVFSSAYFDSSTGFFRATIQVPQTDGPLVNVDFYGTIDGAAFSGRVESTGYPEQGATVALERDPSSSSLQPILSPAPGEPGEKEPSQPSGTQKIRYSTDAQFYDGTVRATSLVVSKRAITTEEEWVTALLPTRTVGVSLEMAHGNYFTQKAVLDLRTRTLRGRLSDILDLDCVETGLGNGKKGWNCTASGLRGTLLTGLFEPGA